MKIKHGRKRLHKSKKAYKAHCRNMVLSGLINNARGEWVNANISGCSNGTVRNIQAGYKIG